MIGINLMLPTRKRAKEAKEAIASALDLAGHPTRVKIVLRTDLDDPTDYSGVYRDHLLLGPKLGCSPAYQEIARIFPNDLVMVFADDLRFRTKGWDLDFEEVYSYNKGLPFALYANDQHTKMATHPVVPRSWLKLFGGLWGVPFEHFYSDTWIDDVARRAGYLNFLPETIAEHASPKYDKMPKDETWHESRWEGKIEGDKALFKDNKEMRDEWVEKLKEARK